MDDNKENNLTDTEINDSSTTSVEETVSVLTDAGADVATASEEKLVMTNKSITSRKRVLQGVVVSNKPNKTIVVKFERQVAHPLYKKYYRQSKKVMAHDEKNECNIGDVVKIKEHRPLSARKRWQLIEIVQRAK